MTNVFEIRRDGTYWIHGLEVTKAEYDYWHRSGWPLDMDMMTTRHTRKIGAFFDGRKKSKS